jgi:hypothetical protein
MARAWEQYYPVAVALLMVMVSLPRAAIRKVSAETQRPTALVVRLSLDPVAPSLSQPLLREWPTTLICPQRHHATTKKGIGV